MKNVCFAAGALLACACSSSSDATVLPSHCDISDRMGTYLDHYAERSGGTCGAIPDQVGRVDGPSGLPEGCALDGDDRVSENGCKLERTYTCDFPADGVIASYTGVTQAEDAGANRLIGILTVRVSDSSGSFLCSSTYDLTFTRQ
jgi:hypothetical protein